MGTGPAPGSAAPGTPDNNTRVKCHPFPSWPIVQVTQRTGFTGSALVRLLARLTDVEVAESRQSFSDQLSQWLRWTDAIALSAALEGGRTAAPARKRTDTNADDTGYGRVRAALAKAIAEDIAFLADRRDLPADGKPDFSPYRVRYAGRQQAMEVAIGPLRTQLRAMLAARSSDMARLAAVDAVMEQALGAQERSLLATVPGLLEKHFRRLHQAAQARADAPASDVPDALATPERRTSPTAWLDKFCEDMRAVMLAELDMRLQPVDGLREALRMT